jgi:Arc/MetJ-type ribon-helix-helix transcriptional regulator
MSRPAQPFDSNKPGTKKQSVSFPRPMLRRMRDHVAKTKPKYASVSHYLQCLVEDDLQDEATPNPAVYEQGQIQTKLNSGEDSTTGEKSPEGSSLPTNRRKRQSGSRSRMGKPEA